MPRQRNLYNRRTYVLPEDFPQRLRRFQEESGLSWSEIARRLETYRHTVGVGRKAERGPTTSTGRRYWNWPTAWASDTCSPTEAARDRRGPKRKSAAYMEDVEAGQHLSGPPPTGYVTCIGADTAKCTSANRQKAICKLGKDKGESFLFDLSQRLRDDGQCLGPSLRGRR